MRSMLAALVLPAVLVWALPALAQMSADPATLAQIQAAQAQAQAAAARPGDEALTCEQLQAEFVTTMNDPTMRQSVDELGQWAQRQKEKARGAQASGMAMAGTSMAMGLASSFIPGMGYAQMAMMQAQMAGMQRRADEANRDFASQTGNMQGMMPAAYRGQRLYELAQAKQCTFLQNAPSPGIPSDVPPLQE